MLCHAACLFLLYVPPFKHQRDKRQHLHGLLGAGVGNKPKGWKNNVLGVELTVGVAPPPL